MHNRRMADQQNTLGDTPAVVRAAPPDQPEQIAALAADLLDHMRAALDRAAEDPFSNPVMTMALGVSRRIDQGTLTDVDLTSLVCWLRDEAFQARAARIASYVGLDSGIAPEAAMAELARRLVRPDPHDSAIPFAQFRGKVERTRFSAVFTAHPTFSLPYPVGDALARAASGEIGTACFASHRPVQVTLEDEFDQAHAAIARGRDALDLLTGAILDAARETWAGRWLDLAPRPITLTTWVGYDTDGRNDIGWWDTLRLRLRMKLYQLERVEAQLLPLPSGTPVLARVRTAIDAVRDQIAAAPNGLDAAAVGVFAQALVGRRDDALVTPEPLLALFPAALGDGETALASLIVNQASFAVVDALADDLAQKLRRFAVDVVVGLPTLGLTLASAAALKLGHSRYVPLGVSRKFWYREELSAPLSSITTPDQAKRLYVDPRMSPLLAGARVALIDDVVSSGASMASALQLMTLCGCAPVVIGAAMLQSERWRPRLAALAPEWPDRVVASLRTPLLARGADGRWTAASGE